MKDTKKSDEQMRKTWNKIQDAAIAQAKKEGPISDEEMDDIDARISRRYEEIEERRAEESERSLAEALREQIEWRKKNKG